MDLIVKYYLLISLGEKVEISTFTVFLQVFFFVFFCSVHIPDMNMTNFNKACCYFKA